MFFVHAVILLNSRINIIACKLGICVCSEVYVLALFTWLNAKLPFQLIVENISSFDFCFLREKKKLHLRVVNSWRESFTALYEPINNEVTNMNDRKERAVIR